MKHLVVQYILIIKGPIHTFQVESDLTKPFLSIYIIKGPIRGFQADINLTKPIHKETDYSSKDFL